MCKYWKINGHSIESKDGEKWSDHKRRMKAKRDAEFYAHGVEG